MAFASSAARLLRTYLKEALREMDPAALEPLGAFGTWQGLLALWETGWLGTRRPTAHGLSMQLRRRLRELGAARRPCAAVLDTPPGIKVLVCGRLLSGPPDGGPLWAVDDATGALVGLEVDRAEVAGGLALAQGLVVAALGFADREVDAAGIPAPDRGPPTRGRVRGGPTLPLVVAIENAGRLESSSPER